MKRQNVQHGLLLSVPSDMSTPVKISIALISLAILTWLAFGFFGIQALFYDRVVDEKLPNQIMTSSSQDLLGKGAFQQGDSTYTISGDALLSMIDGSHNLSFKDFNVTNGPDLFVYAVKTNSTDNTTVKQTVSDGGFINLGTLKGNIGNQNYVLDATFNPDEYQVIAIWCRRFSRNFGSVHLLKK